MGQAVRLILVTGTPRSGSTAIGHHLALGRGVRPLYEPFNVYAGMWEVSQYFEIPGTQSFSYKQMDDCIAKLQALTLNLKPGIFPKNKGLWRLFKSIWGGRSMLYYRLCKLDPFLHTVIWKDPLACFTVDYVSREHLIDVVVPYRNPWAVAASFKRLNWSFNLESIQARLKEIGISLDVLNQPISLNQHCEVHSSVMNGGLLWHIIHLVLMNWQRNNKKIKFINLDRIIESPSATYQMIYNAVHLSYSLSTERKIKEIYGRQFKRSQPRSNLAHDWRRNIKDMNQYWTHTLTPSEIDYIQTLNHNLWQQLQLECITQTTNPEP